MHLASGSGIGRRNMWQSLGILTSVYRLVYLLSTVLVECVEPSLFVAVKLLLHNFLFKKLYSFFTLLNVCNPSSHAYTNLL